MKGILTTAILLMVAALSFNVAAQELPASYGFGMLVNAEDDPIPAAIVTLNQNLHQIRGASGDTKIQLYLAGSALYLDDYYADQVDPQVLALEGIPTIQLFANKITLAVGIGARWEMATGDDGLKWPMGGEIGWRIVPDYATLNAGFLYIPMNAHRPDYWFPSVSIGLDAPRVLSAFTSWLAR